jgi:hypothetical protein
MNGSLLFFAVLVVLLLTVQVGFYLTIKRFAKKWSGQKTANGVLISMPAIVTFAAIIIANSFFTIPQPPRGIDNADPIDSIERAAKRINDLELHTAHLENYLMFERRRQLILAVGLTAIFAISLTTIGFGIYKPAEDE